MNKNIIKSILFGSVLLTSCNRDLLSPYTPGALTQEVAIKNVSDLSLLLNSAYSAVNSRTESEEVSVFTDECGIGYANGGQGISNDNEYFFLMTPQVLLPNALWGSDYVALAYINRVIAFSATVPTGSTSDEITRKQVLAQAYALRAYCHLQILSYFTTDMTSDTALAGILADRVFDVTAASNRQRATNKQFYDLIQADCNQSIAIYNSLGAAGLDKTTANKFFALGLKARAYEYKGDYPNAENYANQVITQSGLILANSAAAYQRVFFTDDEASNVETIFRLKRTPLQNGQPFSLHNAWCSITPNFTGSPFYEISRALFNKVAANNTFDAMKNPAYTDVRYRTMVAPTSKIDANYSTSSDYRNSDVLVVNKHGGTAIGSTTAATTASPGFNNDIKIMRLSEMYLIRAEARAAASDLPGAAAAVNEIRQVRIFPNLTTGTPALPLQVYSSPTAAWKGILDERRIEFAFEGYRFIDLKRIGTKAGAKLDRDPADYTSSSANYPAANPVNLPLTSNKFALPIPQVELTSNNVITQNPGY
ncbi:MAG: RagB/SusD family nutrient uptake outer membrane protein [Oligoflexus sp.]|nr:RagB/SusD family nutrient uptake outer membrane protein [Pseudopedobacter sp.]